MNILIAILAIGLFSCGQITIKSKKLTSDSTQNERKDIASTTFIDIQLKAYLDTMFIGWSLSSPDRWDSVWYNQYKNNGILVNYLKGDFDCNKEPDYALLFKRSDGNLVVYAFLMSDKIFRKYKLIDFGKDEGQLINYGIDLIEPGKINYFDPESDDSPFIVSECNAIQVFIFEKGAETFYWENGKLKSVPTGD